MSKRDILKLAVFVAVIAAAFALVLHIDTSHDNAETEIVRNAVRNAALTCYAVEGAYSDSVDYLRDHYRLAYDEERYYVTYEAFASNRLPDIYVTEKGAKAQ